ncbi:hypothetical protein KEM55_000119, partial [Ascosphaera atra]
NGSVIASSFTSPIDALYLAAIFDPIFTVSYPYTHKVRQISLLEAILRAFATPELLPPGQPHAQHLTTVSNILARNPDRIVAVFPECTTTNGKGILRLSPSLTGVGIGRKIYPVSLRYTPADITTPVPATYISFLWYLLRKPTHCIRVRIAESIVVPAAVTVPSDSEAELETLTAGKAKSERETYGYDAENSLTGPRRELLAQVGESLARLARVRRVGLGAKEKAEFAEVWRRKESKTKRL